jgi:hypothetical protein
MQATISRDARPGRTALAVLSVLAALVGGGLAGYGVRSFEGFASTPVHQAAPALVGTQAPACVQDLAPSLTC